MTDSISESFSEDGNPSKNLAYIYRFLAKSNLINSYMWPNIPVHQSQRLYWALITSFAPWVLRQDFGGQGVAGFGKSQFVVYSHPKVFPLFTGGICQLCTCIAPHQLLSISYQGPNLRRIASSFQMLAPHEIPRLWDRSLLPNHSGDAFPVGRNWRGTYGECSGWLVKCPFLTTTSQHSWALKRSPIANDGQSDPPRQFH